VSDMREINVPFQIGWPFVLVGIISSSTIQARSLKRQVISSALCPLSHNHQLDTSTCPKTQSHKMHPRAKSNDDWTDRSSFIWLKSTNQRGAHDLKQGSDIRELGLPGD
jgi:hypothetical protein